MHNGHCRLGYFHVEVFSRLRYFYYKCIISASPIPCTLFSGLGGHLETKTQTTFHTDTPSYIFPLALALSAVINPFSFMWFRQVMTADASNNRWIMEEQNAQRVAWSKHVPERIIKALSTFPFYEEIFDQIFEQIFDFEGEYFLWHLKMS